MGQNTKDILDAVNFIKDRMANKDELGELRGIVEKLPSEDRVRMIVREVGVVALREVAATPRNLLQSPAIALPKRAMALLSPGADTRERMRHVEDALLLVGQPCRRRAVRRRGPSPGDRHNDIEMISRLTQPQMARVVCEAR